MNTTKAHEAVRIAQEIAKHAKSATDFHNLFFGIGGKFGDLFPTRDEREAFAQTPEYHEIIRLRAVLAQSDKVATWAKDVLPGEPSRVSGRVLGNVAGNPAAYAARLAGKSP